MRVAAAPGGARQGPRFAPRLRTVLVALHALLLLLPLGGVVLLRLYESALIRRTEAELAAQGAVVSTLYRRELADAEAGAGGAGPGPPPLPTAPAFAPYEARLDLRRDPVLPPPPPARPAEAPPSPAAAAAGARVTAVLREAQAHTLAGVRVVDETGVVVATSRGELGLSLAHAEEVARALHGERASALRERVSDEPRPPLASLSRGTRLRVFVALPVVDGGRTRGAVLLSRTPMGVAQSLYGIRGLVAAAALLLVLLVAATVAVTTSTIARPVRALVAKTERLARGDPDALEPLARPGTDEIRQLSEAFARTARVLAERGDYIRGFAANVSHEFKTPLASIRATVELLRDHLDGMTPAERERFLGNLERDAARLERLVRGLLELARADVTRPGTEAADAGEVADALGRRFAAAGLALEAEVERDGGGAGPRVRMGREPLESVVGNLLENARLHAGPGARVRLRAARRGEHVELTVADNGPGISPANRARVFERFFTTRREQGGTGLGLAVVRALVEAHGGRVTLESRPGETLFRVELPAAKPDDIISVA